MNDPTAPQPQSDYGPQLKCLNCGNEVFRDFKFCSSCGTKRIKAVVQPRKSVLGNKNFISITTYFFITITLLSIYKTTELFDGSGAYLILLLVFAIIDLAYAAYNGKPSFLFSFKPVKAKPLLQMLGILLAGAFVVHYLADFLNTTLFDEYVWDESITWDTLGVSLLLIAVYPAIFEEITFRGFLFHNVEQLSGKRTAVIVSSLIFGITHLSFVSLIWHVPLGYLFAVMRSKYNTLWYGVIGHFFYNAVVTVIDMILST